MVQLLELPPEIHLNIIHYLDFEDIRALRASCRIFSNLCVDFMKDQTIFISNCCFPKDLFDYKFECVQQKLHFGEFVTIDFKDPKLTKRKTREETYNSMELYSVFLTKFCKNFTSLSFEHCNSIGNKDILELLEYFPKLTRLCLRRFDGKATHRYQISETLERVLKNLNTITFDSPLLNDPLLGLLLSKMSNVEDVNIQCRLEPKFRVKIRKFLRNQASKLKYIHCGYESNEIPRMLQQIPDGQLQLKGISFGISEMYEYTLSEVVRRQENLEVLRISGALFHENEFIESIGTMFPHLKEFSLIDAYSHLMGLSFMRGLDELETLTLGFGHIDGVFNNFKSLHHVAYGLDGVYPKLRNLIISNIKGSICTSCWEKITVSFPNLQNLTAYSVNIDVESIHYIFKNFQLKSLTLDSCNITDQHLIETPTKAGISTQRNLKRLSLQVNPITAIPALPNLRKLDVSSSGIRSIECFSKDFPFLVKLSVNDCHLEFPESPQPLTVTILDISKYYCEWQMVSWRSIPKMFPRLRILIATDFELTVPERCQLFEDLPDLMFIKSNLYHEGDRRLRFEDIKKRSWKTISRLYMRIAIYNISYNLAYAAGLHLTERASNYLGPAVEWIWRALRISKPS